MKKRWRARLDLRLERMRLRFSPLLDLVGLLGPFIVAIIGELRKSKKRDRIRPM
jgi:hypothetical protein